MERSEMATVCGWVASNWPAAAMTKGTLEIFELELADLPFDATLATLRSTFAEAEFPPTPMRLRAAVERALGPRLPDWDEVLDELAAKVASVGRYNDEPEWSHPVVGAVVAQRGGWSEMCASMPTRDLFTPDAAGAWNTYAAQFRDSYRNLAARGVPVPAARPAIGAGDLDTALLTTRKEIE